MAARKEVVGHRGGGTARGHSWRPQWGTPTSELLLDTGPVLATSVESGAWTLESFRLGC